MRYIKIESTNAAPFVLGLLGISFLAFWPSYFSVFFTSEGYMHFHFFTSLVWFALLLVQPYLIKSRRLDMHRRLGKISYFVAGLIVVSILLLAQNRMANALPERYWLQTHLLYLQLSLALLFALSYGLAIFFRKNSPIHARFMMATSLTFIDPILARIIFGYLPQLSPFSQWISFGVISIILILLSVNDRKDQNVKWVFPSLLLLHAIFWIPTLFWLTESAIWQSFATWYGSLKF